MLEDIGAGKLPSLVILNKIDIVDSSRKALLEKEFPEAIAMSALNTQDIEALHSRLVTFFLDTMTEVELVVPYGEEGVLADIARTSTCSASRTRKRVFVSRSRRTLAPLPP